ncbi:MAG: MoxR family ATPase, partial [Pseudomonadota bacterium]
EMEGTYPLPEAQLDRFMLKLVARFPDVADLSVIVDRATGAAAEPPTAVLDADALMQLRQLTRTIVVADHVKDYALRLVTATHPESADAPEVTRRYVRHGASPRGALSVIRIAKARALMDARLNISFDDIKASCHSTLRHRIVPSFEAEAEGITPDAVIDAMLEAIPLTQGD